MARKPATDLQIHSMTESEDGYWTAEVTAPGSEDRVTVVNSFGSWMIPPATADSVDMFREVLPEYAAQLAKHHNDLVRRAAES